MTDRYYLETNKVIVVKAGTIKSNQDGYRAEECLYIRRCTCWLLTTDWRNHRDGDEHQFQVYGNQENR